MKKRMTTTKLKKYQDVGEVKQTMRSIDPTGISDYGKAVSDFVGSIPMVGKRVGKAAKEAAREAVKAVGKNVAKPGMSSNPLNKSPKPVQKTLDQKKKGGSITKPKMQIGGSKLKKYPDGGWYPHGTQIERPGSRKPSMMKMGGSCGTPKSLSKKK